MISEIGSEFWDVPVSMSKKNSYFPDIIQWFLSGRIALNYILSDIKIKHSVKEAWLPSWCCDSMIKPFIDNDFSVNFYSVYYDGKELIQEIPEKAELILVMDYFGYSGKYDFSTYDGIVIRDLTHTIFCKEYKDADYYFGSIRKWCGIWTGGFAFGKKLYDTKIKVSAPNKQYIELRKKAMNSKNEYIEGLCNNKGFLESFAQAENILDEIADVEGACERDIQLMDYIDINFIKNKRRENAQVLLDQLGEMSIFSYINKNDCPLFVPILVEDREKIKKELIKNGVFCPVHWPTSELHSLNRITKTIYEKEISLICDQRYTVDDMNRIVHIIKKGVM